MTLQQTPAWELIWGDSVQAMRDMAVARRLFDAVVTDPPYHLTDARKRFVTDNAGRTNSNRGFMSKIWDGGDLAFRPETWAACLDLLPPGGHLAAFGSARTYRRLACAVEDAGFEIRDQIMWLHSQGQAKNRDVARDIGRLGGSGGVAMRRWVSRAIAGSGMADRGIARALARSNNLVKYWRQGIRNVSPEDAARLASALGLEIPGFSSDSDPTADWEG